MHQAFLQLRSSRSTIIFMNDGRPATKTDHQDEPMLRCALWTGACHVDIAVDPRSVLSGGESGSWYADVGCGSGLGIAQHRRFWADRVSMLHGDRRYQARGSQRRAGQPVGRSGPRNEALTRARRHPGNCRGLDGAG